MKNIFPLLYVLCLLGLDVTTSQTAFAQDTLFPPSLGFQGEEEEKPRVVNQYDPKYRKSAENYGGKSNGLLAEDYYELSFTANELGKSDAVTLQIVNPVSVEGCVEITPPYVWQDIRGKTLWVNVKPPEITIRRHVLASERCESSGQASASIELDRKSLMENEITQVAFKTSTLVDHYNLELSSDHITLKPQTMNTFKPGKSENGRDALSLSTTPENLVVLYVANTGLLPGLTPSVISYARTRGMIEASELSPDFAPPFAAEDHYYFIDKLGNYSASLEKNQAEPFTTMTIYERFYGPNGPYMRPTKRDVYIRKL